MTDTFKIDGAGRRFSFEFDASGATAGDVEVALTAPPLRHETLLAALANPGRVVQQHPDRVEVMPPEYNIVRGWPDGKKDADE